ncbi:hypothetical protein HDR66_03555 [bacterium]|nr:hypothetical protein [bacterium]
MRKLILCFIVGAVIGTAIGWQIWGTGIHFGASYKCLDGTSPDKYGCCAGEVYTDMGELGFNCCPDFGDCFPPIK